MNLIRPETLANKVSSFPRPTFRPGFTFVPRWRTMIVPPGTNWPPKALKPRRCELESRPFRELPNPFLCAIAHLKIWDFVIGYTRLSLLLFLRSRLLRCCLLGRRFLFSLRFRRSSFCSFFRGCLFYLGFFLRKLWRLEGLPIERDLGNAHRSECLAMPAQLLVLLLPLVVEDDNLVATAVLDDFAEYMRIGACFADLSSITRNGEDVAKFNTSVGSGALL